MTWREAIVLALSGMLLAVLLFACSSQDLSSPAPDLQMEEVGVAEISGGWDLKVFYLEHQGTRCFAATRGDSTVALTCDWSPR